VNALRNTVTTPPQQDTRTAADVSFPAKGELCGIAYSRGTLPQFHAAICRWLWSDRAKGLTVGYVNPHVFNLAVGNPLMRAFLRQADIVTVDGVGFSVGVWLLNRENQPRTVMTPLFDRTLATETLPALRAVVLGGTEAVARKGSDAINRAGRKISVVASIDGYQPLDRCEDFVRAHPEAELVLVAMGSPRSEEFILRARSLFPGKFFWNIGGGTLRFYAGDLRRVPVIVSRLCLQWLWRIMCEPSLTPRYLLGIPLFARHLARRPKPQTPKAIYEHSRG